MIRRSFLSSFDWVFEWKSVWGWERHEEGKVREKQVIWKTVNISPIKLKTRIFGELASHKVTHEKCLWSTKGFAGRLYSQKSHESFYLKFCVFIFCLNSFSQEELSHELLAKMPLKKFLMKNMRNVIFKKKIKTGKHKNTLKNI